MSYSYAKRSFPRRRRPGGGGAAGWLAAVMLAVAIGGLWWAQREPSPNDFPEDIPIIPSSSEINNPEETTTAVKEEKNTESTLTLHLEGFTVWGVQKGIYGTKQAAQEAAGETDILFEAKDGCRVIESVWGQKNQAKARGDALSQDSYAAELTSSGLNLKLTGDSEKLKNVEKAVRIWETELKTLLEAQNLLEEGAMSMDTARNYAAAVKMSFMQARDEIPDETQILSGMREALEASIEAMEEIVAENASEKVDFVGNFRYNVGISHNIYNDYLGMLLSS